MREISNTEGYLRGKVRGNLRGCSTTLLVYASAQKNSAMELRELQTRGRGRVHVIVLVPVPGKIPGHGNGMSAGRSSCPQV